MRHTSVLFDRPDAAAYNLVMNRVLACVVTMNVAFITLVSPCAQAMGASAMAMASMPMESESSGEPCDDDASSSCSLCTLQCMASAETTTRFDAIDKPVTLALSGIPNDDTRWSTLNELPEISPSHPPDERPAVFLLNASFLI